MDYPGLQIGSSSVERAWNQLAGARLTLAGMIRHAVTVVRAWLKNDRRNAATHLCPPPWCTDQSPLSLAAAA
jgi:hypothetical protein